MPEPPGYAVTGATGAVGGRVARRLADRGVGQRLIVRDPARAPRLPGTQVATATYSDSDAMRRALDGVPTVFLVAGQEAADRVRQHVTAIDAAVAAGVERIVYLSYLNAAPDATFTFARDHWHTEQHVRSTGVRHTFLRCSTYLDFVPMLAASDGVIRGPGGDGHVGPVARDDIADVAVAVLLGDGHDGRTYDGRTYDDRTYDLTGAERLTLLQIAAELTRATGRPVTYQEETLDEAYASRASFGAPDWEVAGWVTTYLAIAKGELDVLSDTVIRLAGHPPIRLADFLREHPDSYRHLVSG